MIDATERAAAPILIRRLGVFTAISVAWEIERAKKRGEPFETLQSPVDQKERLSREQIGPAILLYRALLERHVPDALSIAEDVIIAGAVVFLTQSIGALDREEIGQMTDGDRANYLDAIGDKFFNATLTWTETSASQVGFEVSSCHFPRLCAAVGCPELAPSFCKGDATFFGSVVENVELERPTTIAGGDSYCDFRLFWCTPD